MLQVISFSVHFINLFFLCFKFISIHYTTIPQNKEKQKITEIKIQLCHIHVGLLVLSLRTLINTYLYFLT